MNQWRLNVICLLVLGGLLAPVAFAQEPQAVATTLTGKIVVIYYKADAKAAAVLSAVETAKLGAHDFLVGRSVDLGNPGAEGVVQWIPISEIGRLNVFDSVEDLRGRNRPAGGE